MSEPLIGDVKLRKVRIVGGGFSGLTLAYFLLKSKVQIEIVEKQARTGGMLGSPKFSNPGFGIAELAANGVFKSVLFHQICQEIGCPLIQAGPKAKARYIFWKGRARTFPLGLSGVLGLVKFVVKYFFLRSTLKPRAFETMQAWGFRNLGKQATENLLAAGLQGIYAGDVTRMSASLILSRFFKSKPSSQANDRKPFHGRPNSMKAELESSTSNLDLKSVAGTWAPLGGMQEFIQRLTEYLKAQGAVFRLHHDFYENTGTGSESETQLERTVRREACDALVLATSGNEAGRILRKIATDARSPGARSIDVKSIEEMKQDRDNQQLDMLCEWAQKLAEIETAPLVTATAVYSGGESPVTGFGCLFPPNMQTEVLGVLFNHDIFPSRFEAGVRSETWILGGAKCAKSGFCDQSDQEIESLVMQFKKKYFHVSDPWAEMKITRWPEALPHYTVELERLLASQPVFSSSNGLPSTTNRNHTLNLKSGLSFHLYLTGNYLGQIGLAQILERNNKLACEILLN